MNQMLIGISLAIGAIGGSLGTVLGIKNTASIDGLQDKVREIEAFLTKLGDKAELTAQELDKVQVLVADLIRELDDENFEALVEGLPPVEKARILEHYLSLKQHYHVLLTTLLVDLNTTSEKRIAELKEHLLRNADEVQSVQRELSNMVRDVRSDVDRLTKLLHNVSSLERTVDASVQNLKFVQQLTEDVIRRLKVANTILRKSGLFQLILFLIGVFFGLFAPLLVQPLMPLLPEWKLQHTIAALCVLIITCVLLQWLSSRPLRALEEGGASKS